MFLGAQPVIIILQSTLATDFLSHAHTIRPVLTHMTTLAVGSLDLTFLDHAHRLRPCLA
jgi:hypothetical protein